ncbi:MAG: hypothetical protein SFU84_00170 [Gemmatimonadales bacterium]|nr:hypothetical protein [Gemmatimonadales bacterium]
MDSTLSFDALVAHVGGDPWVNGHCSALHMRVYVGGPGLLPGDAEFERGMATARAFFSPVARRFTEITGWRVTRLSWEANYGDYGGTANVEFWTRSVKGRALVLVFTYEGEKSRLTVDQLGIMASFRSAEE